MLKYVVEVIHSYNSLLVNYNSTIENIYSEIFQLKHLLSKVKVLQKSETKLFHIPVCYNQEFCVDLAVFRQQKGLETETLVTLHTSPVYTIYFMGFLPGFLYLGGLDERLYCARKDQPRRKIPKGAVAIGGQQTGIYPMASPGGWQIIGNCPLNLFDPYQNPPSIFSAGDKIQFYPIDLKEHQKISKAVSEGTYSIKTSSI